MALLMVIIYLVMGFGAYWAMSEEVSYIKAKIMKFSDDSDVNFENLNRFEKAMASIQYIPKKVHGYGLLVMAAFAAIIAFAAWPILSIWGCIYYWVAYKRICRN